MAFQPLLGGVRYLAFVLDILIVLGTLYVFLYFGAALFVSDNENYSSGHLLTLLYLPAAFLYFLSFESTVPGGTPAKLLLRLRLGQDIAVEGFNWRLWARVMFKAVMGFLPMGMVAKGLQVTQADAFRAMGAPEAFIVQNVLLFQYFIAVNLLIGFICMVAVPPRRTPLHDAALKTRVRWASEQPPEITKNGPTD